MNNLELVNYLSGWIKRLENEGTYESQKIRTLLDSYQGMVVSEMVVDATLEDLKSGSLACEME